ncbi:hypothetical protein Tco_0568585 [Tanacetum coccineum]
MENSIIPYTKKNTTNVQRQSIYQALPQDSFNGQLRKGSIRQVASLYIVCPKTVSRIWHQAMFQVDHGLNVDLLLRMPTVVGRKRVQIDMDEVSQIPLRRPRPRFDASCNKVFSGKIGIYPLTTLEPAKRSSKNRVARTLETKPILSVTKEITRSWLIQKVLPDIRAKWSRGHTGPIYIQQDNARPHIDVNDSEFLEAASRDGFDIRLCFQPPNSSDLNVLDLGFFSSNPITSRTRGFRLERKGNLPLQIECDQDLISEARSYLHG